MTVKWEKLINHSSLSKCECNTVLVPLVNNQCDKLTQLSKVIHSS